jgi:cobalamin biosynthesis protein CobT
MLDTVFARLYGGDLLVDMRNKSEEIFRRRFPAGVFTRLAALLEEVDKMVDTSDANKLAKRILKMLKDEQEKQQQQRQQRSGDANGDPASDKDDGDAIQGQNPQRDGQVDEPDQSGDTRGQDDGQDDDARDTGAGGSTPQDQQGRGAGAEGTEDDHDVIQQVLDAGEDELPDDLGDVLKRVLNAAKDNSCNTTMAKSHRPETLGKETRLMEIASAATVQLRTRLANLVQAQRWNRLETRRTGRILDTRRLYRSQAGDNRIFLRRNESVAPNTAVQILLDRSGSMCGQRIEVGQQAVLAAALAMESITGTVVQTAAFPYGEDDVDVLVLTAFGERVQNTSAAYQLLGDGGTPLAEAMLWAGHELIKREEPRKILLVATDGDPDDSCAVIDLVERFQESGIEVYALGIQSHKGASLFPNHRIIQRLSDLPAAMIGMLQEAILKRAA